MAKAKEIIGLECDAGARESAAKVLRARFDEVLDFSVAALDLSVSEGVHDMRVATRRLRSALQDFAPLMNKETLRPVKKDLKKIADALGAARDLDVAIASLIKLHSKAKAATVKKGIEKLIKERRARLQRAQFVLTEILAAGRVSPLQTDFPATIDEAFSQTRPDENISFKQAGREAMAARLREFCDLSEKIYEPFDGAALHKLRISAKRLRYAIELFAVCWNDSLKPFAEELSEMQSFLGEIHDGDVQIESLSRLLAENGAAGKSDRNAVEWLLSEYLKARAENYLGALKLWSEWKENEFFERMQAAISEAAS
jgi:CHAD domain-containing protein